MTERVYFDGAAIIADHVAPLPARSLVCDQMGDDIRIRTRAGMAVVALPYWRLRGEGGRTFASAAEAKEYFDGEFARHADLPEIIDGGNF